MEEESGAPAAVVMLTYEADRKYLRCSAGFLKLSVVQVLLREVVFKW